MLRALFAVSLTALVAGCASIPEQKQGPAQKSQAAKARPAPVAKAVPRAAEKPIEQKKKSFKERWLSRFFKDRAQ